MLKIVKKTVLRSISLLVISNLAFGSLLSSVNAADTTSVTIEGTNITSSTTSGTGTGSGTGSSSNVSINYDVALGGITSSLLSSGQKFRTGDMNGDGVPDIVVEKLVTGVKYLDLYVFRNGGYELATTVDTKAIATSFLGQGQASETGQLYSGVILALDTNTKALCAPVYADFIAGKENLADGSDYKKKLLPCLRKVNSSTNNTVRIENDTRKDNLIYGWDEQFIKIPINYSDAYGVDYYFTKDESGKGKLIVQVSFVGTSTSYNTRVVNNRNGQGGYDPVSPLKSVVDTTQDINGTIRYQVTGTSAPGGTRATGVKLSSTGEKTENVTGICNSQLSTGSRFSGLTLVLQTTSEIFNKSLEVTGFSSGKIGDTSYAALGYSTLSSKLITKGDVNGDGQDDITVYKTDPKITGNIAATYLYDSAQQIYVYSSGSSGGGTSSTSSTASTLNQDINNDTQEDALFTSKSGDYTTATYYINSGGTYSQALTIPEATIIEYKDLNQDDNTTLKGAKDIIVTKKVGSQLFYTVYIYNKTSKTFISVLDSASTTSGVLEALSYLVQDVNGDGNLDIVFKKSDGKLYIYTYDTSGTGTTGDVVNSMKLLTSIDGDEFKFLTIDNNTSRDLVTRKYLGLFGGKKYYKFDVYFYDSVTKSYVKKHVENLLLGTDLNLFTDQANAADLVDYNKDNIKDVVLEGATTKGIYYFTLSISQYVYLDKVLQTTNLADYLLWNDQTNTTYGKQVFNDEHLILIDNTGKVRHYYYDSVPKLYKDAASTYTGTVYSATTAINVNVNTGTADAPVLKKLTDPKEFKSFAVNGKKIWVLRDRDNKLVIFKDFSSIKPDADNIITGLVSTSDLNKADGYSFTNYLYLAQPLYVFASDTYKSVGMSGNNTKNVLLLDGSSSLVGTTTIATLDSTTNVFHTYDSLNLGLNSASTKDIDKSINAFIVKKVTGEAIPVVRIQKILDMGTINIPATTKTLRTGNQRFTYLDTSRSDPIQGITFGINGWTPRSNRGWSWNGTETITVNAGTLPGLNLYHATVLGNKTLTTSTEVVSYFGNSLIQTVQNYAVPGYTFDPNTITSTATSDPGNTQFISLGIAIGGRQGNLGYRTPIGAESLILSTFRDTKPKIQIVSQSSEIIDSTKDLSVMQTYNIVSTDTTGQTLSETKTCDVNARTRLPRTGSCTVTFSDGTTQAPSCLAGPGIRRRVNHNCTATATKTTTNLTKKDFYIKGVKDSTIVGAKVNTSYYSGATLYAKEKNFFTSTIGKQYFDSNTLSDTAPVDRVVTSLTSRTCSGGGSGSRNLVGAWGNGSTLSGTRKSYNGGNSVYCLQQQPNRSGWTQTNNYMNFATSN